MQLSVSLALFKKNLRTISKNSIYECGDGGHWKVPTFASSASATTANSTSYDPPRK